MTHRLVLEPKAEADIADAVEWYESEAVGLGARFSSLVEETIEKIALHPYQYQIVRRQIRRAPIKGFPYGIMYRVTDDALIVMACFHGRRHPKRWQSRDR